MLFINISPKAAQIVCLELKQNMGLTAWPDFKATWMAQMWKFDSKHEYWLVHVLLVRECVDGRMHKTPQNEAEQTITNSGGG